MRMRKALEHSKTHKSTCRQLPVECMHNQPSWIALFPSTIKLLQNEPGKHHEHASKEKSDKKRSGHYHELINTPEDHSGHVIQRFEDEVFFHDVSLDSALRGFELFDLGYGFCVSHVLHNVTESYWIRMV